MRKKTEKTNRIIKIGAIAFAVCIAGLLTVFYLKGDLFRGSDDNQNQSEISDQNAVLSVKNRRRTVKFTPKPTVKVIVLPSTTVSPTATTPMAITATPTPLAGIQTEAWIYPGPPACNSVNELKTRAVHTVKIEYLTLKDTGKLGTLTEAAYGCNGYTTANVAILKQYASEVYVTISGSKLGMTTMAKNSTLKTNFVQQVASFVNTNGLNGVDIDFEEYSQWSATDYTNFKAAMTSLGTELHNTGKKLQIDLPPIGNAEMQGNYLLKYEDFDSLPIDQLTIMAYDYQYDYGAGTPVQPRNWLGSIIDWAKNKITDDNKISIGIPAYGYKGVCKAYTPSILTYTQATTMPGFSTAIRDAESQEMMWKNNGNCYVYSDTTTLDKKLEVVKSKGITQVSVWHLGGNLWFSK